VRWGIVAQPFEHQAVVCFIGRTLSGIARRIHTRFAAERIHGEARIVGKHEPGRESAIVGGFETGVLFERGAGFFRGRNRFQAGQRLHIDTVQFAGQVKFPKLTGVSGRAPDRHAARLVVIRRR
jgi:hypothetical protein